MIVIRWHTTTNITFASSYMLCDPFCELMKEKKDHSLLFLSVVAIELLAACQAIEFLRPLTTTAPLEEEPTPGQNKLGKEIHITKMSFTQAFCCGALSPKECHNSGALFLKKIHAGQLFYRLAFKYQS